MNSTEQTILWINNDESLYNIRKWVKTIAMLELIIKQAVKEHTIIDSIDFKTVNWGEVWERTIIE